MRVRVTILLPVLLAACLLLLSSAKGSAQSPPVTADEVLAQMMRSEAQRQSAMVGYTAIRRYCATNNQRHAEMVVQVFADENGAKHFTVVSEEGSGAIRKHVFHKMLSEESEASKHGSRESSRLIPANYEFILNGKENLETGPAYAFDVTPKSANKYLIVGKIWVDANDYSIVRVEGQPARSPSFWIRSVHFTHTYQKVGPLWLASSTHSVSDIKIFGNSELTIENSNYNLNHPDLGTSTDPQPALQAKTQHVAFRPQNGATRVSH